MKPARWISAVGAAGAALLFLSRFFPFAEGIPFVGSVALATPGDGGSGLSWAGDTRIFLSAGLFLAAAALWWFRRHSPALLVAGIGTGWLAALVFGALDWIRSQRAMMDSMQIGADQIGFTLGPAFFLWLSGAIVSAVFVVSIAWATMSKQRGAPQAEGD